MATMETHPSQIGVDKGMIGKLCHFFHDSHNEIYAGKIIGIFTDNKHYIIEFTNPGKGLWKSYVSANQTFPI